MRIYIGWKIKSLIADSNHLNDAEIVGTSCIRKSYRYLLSLANGETKTIRREELLKGVREGSIEFTL